VGLTLIHKIQSIDLPLHDNIKINLGFQKIRPIISYNDISLKESYESNPLKKPLALESNYGIIEMAKTAYSDNITVSARNLLDAAFEDPNIRQLLKQEYDIAPDSIIKEHWELGSPYDTTWSSLNGDSNVQPDVSATTMKPNTIDIVTTENLSYNLDDTSLVLRPKKGHKPWEKLRDEFRKPTVFIKVYIHKKTPKSEAKSVIVSLAPEGYSETDYD